MPRASSSSDRLRHEIEHHRDLSQQDIEGIWGWGSPAGRRRADRRGALFVELGRIRAGARVLELGCGTGEFSRRVLPAGADLVGLDLSAELLGRARRKIGGAMGLVRGDAERLPFPDQAFDAVFGCSILHHLDPAQALREVRRVLRPGGRLVFSEPNLLNPQVFLMFKLAPLKPWFGISPDEMAFTRAAITRILDALGFARSRVRYFDFLHPAIPGWMVPTAERVATRLESVPLLRALSGSMLIDAER